MLSSLLFALSIAVTPASAEVFEDVKSYTVTMTDGALDPIFQAPYAGMFWELPQLSSGQRRLGAIELINATGSNITMKLEQIALPYDNEAVMRYLMSLRTVVSDGDFILYDGAYGELVGKNGLVMQTDLSAGQFKVYNISVQCAFGYADEIPELWNMSAWEFSAEHTYTVPRDWESFMPYAYAVGGGILLVLILMIILSVSSKRKNQRGK